MRTGELLAPLAIDSRAGTAVVVIVGLLIFGALLVATAAGELTGRRKAKVPPGYRPAPGDEELERRVLERYLLWGGLATLFMALWIPAYWFREPNRENEKRVKFVADAVRLGKQTYADFCARCHGKKAEGLNQPIVIAGHQVITAEPPLRYIYSRYKAAGRNEDEITQVIYDAINRGRPGTPMPTWGIAFGGPLNSAQVDDVVAFLRSIQDVFPAQAGRRGGDIFAANCAVCHGTGGIGRDDAGNRTPGPNLTVALQRLTVDQLRETILKGRLNTNRPSMPAWAALGNEAIEALVKFIQTIQRG